MRVVLTFLVVIAMAARASAQLPPPPEPPENPITPEKAILGKILFWDEQLSSNNTVACGTCHQPAFGGTSPVSVRNAGPDGVLRTEDDIFGAPGVISSDDNSDYQPDPQFDFKPLVGRRYPMGNLTAAYSDHTFFDGRGSSEFVDPESGNTRIQDGGALESQAIGPIVSNTEMAHDNRTWDEVRRKLIDCVPLALATDLPPDIEAALQQFPTYRELFRNAFGGPKINATRIAFALATYQRTTIPDQTPWDLDTMTDRQRDGERVFNREGRCDNCHDSRVFSDDRFHSIGLRPPPEDRGRQEVTGRNQDRGEFKTGQLRNVGLRPRYMHNGEFATLRAVVEYYDMGGRNHDNQDDRIDPLNLRDDEKNALIDFLKNGLTDPRCANEEFPFDRPTLFLERTDEHNELYGNASQGSGGLRPLLIVRSPANIGNPDFKIGVGNALGGSWALLGVASAPADIDANGVPLNIDFSAALTKLRRLAGTAGAPGEGFATQHLRIPEDPALSGVSFFAQWLVADDEATGGIAASRGAEFKMF